MEKFSKKIIFFLHLNEETMEKGAAPIYNNSITNKTEIPSLLCKMKNKFYKTIYSMYSFSSPISKSENILSLVLQLKGNLNYPFDITINKESFENKKCTYFFYFDKIIFKERIKNNFFDNFLTKNKNLDPPFSCDINIFEQTQLILGYINNRNKQEQFEMLNSLKNELGFSKFSRLSELFLIYLRVIFVDNYNIKLIQELLDNYKYINFDIKNSFNFSLFFDSALKPIFLKPYSNRNFIKYNTFEYDLRECLNDTYNILFDKLCFKYYIKYDIDFLFNENNINSRISKNKQKFEFYQAFYEILSEMNIIKYNNLFINNNLLSKEFIQNLYYQRDKIYDNIKEIGPDKNIINLNNFNGLKFYDLENNYMPFYFFGKINNDCWIRSIDDKELYIYDSVLDVKMRVDYQFSRNTTSVFQLQDKNIIIVYSHNQKICIIDTKNIYKKMNQIYSFKYLKLDVNEIEEYILKVIEIKNKLLVKLSKNLISFYYNKNISDEYSQLYDYHKINEIKQKESISNFAILEFNDNFIIVCSGIFSYMQKKRYFSNVCYLTFIDIKNNINNAEKENSYIIEYSIVKLNALVVYFSVFEDNNILTKLADDILGIGGKNIYLYSLKYKQVFQIVEIPTILSSYQYSIVCSILTLSNNIIYVAVKYFTKKEQTENFILKIYIYSIMDSNNFKNEFGIFFLTEAQYYSQKSFLDAPELQY